MFLRSLTLPARQLDPAVGIIPIRLSPPTAARPVLLVAARRA